LKGREGAHAADLTRARGLLLACGSYGNVLRLMAPLTIEEAVLAKVWTSWVRRWPTPARSALPAGECSSADPKPGR
jgi:hypothetical protein